MEDKTINCIACPDEFVWTKGEQAFMERLVREGKIDKITQPRRCKNCRAKAKAEKESRELSTRSRQGSKVYDDSEFKA